MYSPRAPLPCVLEQLFQNAAFLRKWHLRPTILRWLQSEGAGRSGLEKCAFGSRFPTYSEYRLFWLQSPPAGGSISESAWFEIAAAEVLFCKRIGEFAPLAHASELEVNELVDGAKKDQNQGYHNRVLQHASGIPCQRVLKLG